MAYGFDHSISKARTYWNHILQNELCTDIIIILYTLTESMRHRKQQNHYNVKATDNQTQQASRFSPTKQEPESTVIKNGNGKGHIPGWEKKRETHTRILLGEDWEWWVVMIRDVVHWNTTHKKRERSSIIVCDNPTTLNKMFDLSLEV